MKILLINKFLYRRGGDAIVTLSTGELLRSRGHEVIHWGMKDSRNASFAHADLFIDEVDLNTDGGGLGRQLDLAGKLLYSFEAKRKISELIGRAGKPDIVHLNNFAHQISPSILDVFKQHRIPCVMTMHDYKMVCPAYSLLSHGRLCDACTGGKYYQCFSNGCVKNSKAKSLLNTVEMYLHHNIMHIYDHIDLFISPSQFMKDKIQAMGFRKKIEVLPNFIDVGNYEPAFGAMEKEICYFGRLSHEKGIPALMDAVKQLPQVTLKIIGDGPLNHELKSRIEREGMTNVRLLGYMTGEELNNQIRHSLAVVVPSEWYENNPRSIIEAFALGKPVIGARIGGIPELVRDNETGLTFEHGNANELAAKMSALISEPHRCAAMGRNARRWVEAELNAEKHYERLLAIYERVSKKEYALVRS